MADRYEIPVKDESHGSSGLYASLRSYARSMRSNAKNSNLSLLHRSIIKCALAYLIASLFTYSTTLSAWLASFLPNNDPDDDVPFSNLHMIYGRRLLPSRQDARCDDRGRHLCTGCFRLCCLARILFDGIRRPFCTRRIASSSLTLSQCPLLPRSRHGHGRLRQDQGRQASVQYGLLLDLDHRVHRRRQGGLPPSWPLFPPKRRSR